MIQADARYSDAVKEKKKYVVLKSIVVALAIILAIGIGTVIYLWNLPHKKVENTKGISVTAIDLAKAYTANEGEANVIYLNKAIEVSGVVDEMEKNQDGGVMIVLKTEDPTVSVQCAMRDKKEIAVTKGQSIVIKGFCSGSIITTVSLTDCVLK